MSTSAIALPGRRRRGPSRPADASSLLHDVRLILRQLYYEQLNFWLNPWGAGLTLGFSTVFLVMLASGAGMERNHVLGGVPLIQYYVPAFAAYGVMSACFNNLANSLVARRESGVLKRLRLSPLPTWAMLISLLGNAAIIAALQVVILLTIGTLGYGATLPNDMFAFAATLLLGVACFTALGVAISTLIPNQEAGAPLVNLAFFVLLWLSGLWYPIKDGSTLAHISSFFPVRHLITAAYAPFDPRHGASAWSPHDLLILAIWALVGSAFAIRRFKWAPRRAR